MFLHEVSTPVSHLKGVGPATAGEFARIGITTVRDLLLHLPRDYEDRSEIRPFAAAYEGASVNTIAYVERHDFVGGGRKRTLRVLVRDETADAYLVCFGRNFLAKKLPIGSRVYVAGAFTHRYGKLQSTAFDFEPATDADRPDPGSVGPLDAGAAARFHGIIPIYPLGGSLAQAVVRRAVDQALHLFGEKLEDELPTALKKERDLIDLPRALAMVHHPNAPQEMERGLATLIYRELFFLQLRIGRNAIAKRKGSTMEGSGNGDERTWRSDRPAPPPPTRLRDKLLSRLPFELTPDQRRTIDDHLAALARGEQVSLLLQGEVGSGKTLVAFLMALPYIESGHQAVFLAPTELLARQHAENAARLLAPIGVRLAFLSGSLRPSAREPLLAALKSGTIDILIGTHAVFTGNVEFSSLRFVIVDEQHRFGVLQREAVIRKGDDPDVVLMTATPIPRSLALTVFGQMEVAELKTMPVGRKPIETHLARYGNEQKVYDWVRREIAAGHQAYFVYPLIEQSDKLELRDAESMVKHLEAVFPGSRLGLIHSRKSEEEKITTMRAFQSGEIDILVATSVVEVGVDVPNATCMVVEHAERFGLAALHQLRGRVGRGIDQSYAFFVYSPDLTEVGKKRLKVMLEQSDGFSIAEADLAIRGPGDIGGTEQSGYLKLQIADLARDMRTMQQAREDAFALLESDAGFLAPEHEGLRRSFAAEPGDDEVML